MEPKYRSFYNGKTFGDWTVIRFVRNQEYRYGSKVVRQPFALVRCSCGKEKETRLYDVVKGRSQRCLSCMGKIAASRLPKGKRSGNGRWIGEGDIPGRLIGQIKNGAAARGIDYELAPGFLADLWNQQKGRCAMTGLEMVIPPIEDKGNR